MPPIQFIREDSAYHSFCGLTCVGWLYQKIQDSFFLILGTHTCAHLLQNVLGVMVFARPRFGVALIEEADLSKQQPDLQHLIEEIQRDHHPSVIFLLSSCTPEVMKVEFDGLANNLSTPELPVLFVPASGLDYTFSQAEDSVLQALIPFCPEAPADDRRVVFLGSVNDTIADDFALEAAKLDIPVGGFLPASRFTEMPAIGPGTILAPLQPYLAKVANRLTRERGAKVLSSLFPFGPDGTRAFWEDLAAMFDRKIDLSEREAQSWERIAEHTQLLRDKRVFFTADNLMELPLARFLKNAGCEIVECSSPYINRKFHAREIAALDGVPLYEQPNFNRQLGKIAELQPDLVVSTMATTNPLIGHGVVAKWSTEFSFMPIHGWAGVATLAGMFTKSIKRHAQLDPLDDPVWSAGLMPAVR
ncbi:MAG: ferredoxin:protochlorophyllide reductase (ATP-dependent) subunit N [Chloroflexi bacterium AL-W]|nr:ferredoxin:protochlorophyllide reductase (ATP-dependent) subunit N [Chloroflexi bacterium AL-N1]NOK65162.1 ferredoxin:protochlorophyllide reductase (ATP-dependent) subunit N [Chloroflexi bacterium AL-N10]NOK72572.1 ferredoxin:protochlorophyllide reductase (ATP-dependent) subunit N [Chloroflexi bacterium AL-N5]NOK79341.1 ferredoxin:protochlorophyllide reductase (ATP-dependent) subunit N [Chloroflexi bacterium AL-W]NOK87257.1 ferredoxin:protochlorophyllide reductase (ATP-dependent) subunit N [